ncbi:MAG: hypothetical protein D6691_06295 [Candidatus Hydrogenedentota bacterium]|nr:MAG: hypothetical protein D6691_06295 [Candidatus Hydrogenedentota bacterium]
MLQGEIHSPRPPMKHRTDDGRGKNILCFVLTLCCKQLPLSRMMWPQFSLSVLKSQIVRFSEVILGRSLGPSGRAFLKSVGWIGFSFVVARLFSMGVPLFAARLLGKEIFGEFALSANSIGQIVGLIMLFGMNAAVVRYAAPKAHPDSEVGAAFFISGVSTVIALLATIYLSFTPAVGLLKLNSPALVWWGLVFAVAFWFWTLQSATLQGLHLFRERGVAEIVSGVAMVPSFVLAYQFFGRAYPSLVLAYVISYTLSGAYAAHHVISRVRLRLPNLAFLREILVYGAFCFLGNAGFILTFSVQPMQLNAYLSESEVGFFRAYHMASIGIASYVSTIFNTVFFAKASASSDRGALWRLMWRVWLFAAIPMVIGYVIALVTLLGIAGSDYPLDWRLLVAFGVTATVVTIQSCMGQFLGTEGVKGAGFGLILSIISGVVNVILSMWLIPAYHVLGACLALFATYTLATLLVIRVCRKEFRWGLLKA